MDVEAAVRRAVSRQLKSAELPPETIALDGSLSDQYGMTSMRMVLLVTSLCDEAGISLSAFTDRDLVGLNTSRDVMQLLAAATARLAV